MQDLRLTECQQVLGYEFQNPALLEKALTHSSAKSSTRPSNERLEFLGDSILGKCISEHLFRTYTSFDEGELTKIKSVVVSAPALASEVERLGLEQYVRVGKGIGQHDQLPKSIMADLFEALIAAIYLDGGIEPARRFVMDNLVKHIETVLEDKHQKNYKSLLQQLAQKELMATPVYQVVREEGPDHIKTFEVIAIVRGQRFKPATGRSKKEAEQLAAREALAELQSVAKEPVQSTG